MKPPYCIAITTLLKPTSVVTTSVRTLPSFHWGANEDEVRGQAVKMAMEHEGSEGYTMQKVAIYELEGVTIEMKPGETIQLRPI